MRKWLFLTASVLILVSLALLVIGLDGQPVLWYLGLATLGVAMLLSLATRWVPE